PREYPKQTHGEGYQFAGEVGPWFEPWSGAKLYWPRHDLTRGRMTDVGSLVDDELLLCEVKGVEEGTHRRLAVAPAALMLALVVVLVKPGIEVGLQRFDRVVDLLAERNAVELVEHGLV